MTTFFQVKATWQTPSGRIGTYTARWFGPDASTVRDSVRDWLTTDRRKRIARALDICVTKEN